MARFFCFRKTKSNSIHFYRMKSPYKSESTYKNALQMLHIITVYEFTYYIPKQINRQKLKYYNNNHYYAYILVFNCNYLTKISCRYGEFSYILFG